MAAWATKVLGHALKDDMLVEALRYIAVTLTAIIKSHKLEHMRLQKEGRNLQQSLTQAEMKKITS